jgi:hypothetical protein
MKTKGLLPIIRRVRRNLLPVETELEKGGSSSETVGAQRVPRATLDAPVEAKAEMGPMAAIGEVEAGHKEGCET